MAEHTNQHFVPQYYFRQFAGGQRIHLLLTASDRIVFNAKINRQCARHKFYGEADLEVLLSRMEGRHSAALRHLIDLANDPASSNFGPEDLAMVWEAVLFQRGRTMLTVAKESPAMTGFALLAFKAHLESAPGIPNRDAMVRAIERGEVQVTETPQHAVWRSIAAKLGSALLISDLDVLVLRNLTDYPFVFSDSPVAFYNTYARRVRDRGVLGLQCPGLQIVYPLNSHTLLMLYDEAVYQVPGRGQGVLDVTERSDVSRLNALQLHHSHNAVYFAEERDASYVSDLWMAHKRAIVSPQLRLGRREGWLVDGKPAEGILYQMFEPQLNARLDLTFIHCTPVAPSQYKPRHRSPELVSEQRQRDAVRDQGPRPNRSSP